MAQLFFQTFHVLTSIVSSEIRVQRAEASHRVPENSSAREREHVQLREKKEDMKEREWREERRVRREE